MDIINEIRDCMRGYPLDITNLNEVPEGLTQHGITNGELIVTRLCMMLDDIKELLDSIEAKGK